MNVQHSKTSKYILFGFILVLLLIFVPFPQSASLKGLVTASKQFQLLSNGSDTYSTIFRDLWKNQTLHASSLVPDRGGLFTYQANSTISAGDVLAGDTLGWLSSSMLTDRILNLEGNINTLKASLEFERSGNKATEIEAARLRLTYAKTRLEEQQKILERSRSLLDGKIIPQQEFDLEVRREKLDAIRVSIAEADLGSALSGAQSRKLDVYRSQIAHEEEKLALAQDVLAQLTLVSPLSGMLFFPISEDTLLSIEQVDTMIVTLPIQGGSSSNINWDAHVALSGTNFRMDISPDQMQVQDHILRVAGEQLILVRIRIDNSAGLLVPGQLLEASVKFTPKSVFQSLKELF